MSKPLVSVVMGSTSDQRVMEGCLRTLDEFAIPYEVKILSAHRMPEATLKYAKDLVKRGIKVVVAGAGRAAVPLGEEIRNTFFRCTEVASASSARSCRFGCRGQS